MLHLLATLAFGISLALAQGLPPQSGLSPVPSFTPEKKIIFTLGEFYCMDDRLPQRAASEEIIAFINRVVLVAPVEIRVSPKCEKFARERLSPRAQRQARIVPIDTIWVRDFGPVWASYRNKPVIIDLPYFPNVPGINNDEHLPSVIGREQGIRAIHIGSPDYELHGGNLQVDRDGRCFINNKDPSKLEKVLELLAFIGCKERVVLDPLPRELTKHIDMSFQLAAPGVAFVSDYSAAAPAEVREVQAKNFQKLTTLGVKLIRLPAPVPTLEPQPEKNSERYVFRTYTNSVFYGRHVFVPQYGVREDVLALAVYKKAGYVVHPVKSSDLIQLQGSLHCVVQEQYGNR